LMMIGTLNTTMWGKWAMWVLYMPFCLVLYDLSLLTVIRRAFLNVIINFFYREYNLRIMLLVREIMR
jgi:hypothetical protein